MRKEGYFLMSGNKKGVLQKFPVGNGQNAKNCDWRTQALPALALM